MPGASAKCLKCDRACTRNPAAPIEPCPGCGDREWDREYDLTQHLGPGNEYYIVGERISENGLLMSLELLSALNRNATAQAPLCHRLKSYYRHAKNDLGSRDGHGLMVSLDLLPGDPEGRWGIRIRQQTGWEARRLVTDRCRRHQWAVGVVRQSDDINASGDLVHCTCPADPACEVCTLAAKYSLERRTQPQYGARYWTPLQHAVMRDLGLMA
jgi:hypothetical protein